MGDKLIKVGVVGCGDIFNTHYRAYLENRNAVLTAFFDRVENRAKSQLKRVLTVTGWVLEDAREEGDDEMAETCRCAIDNAKVYTSLDELLDEVDVVDICAPNKYHAPYAAMALERGVGAMVEKPPARNYLETRELLEVAGKSRAKFQLNENVFWKSSVGTIGRLVREGKVGGVIKVESLLGHGGPSWGWNNFFLNPALSGGGALTDMGPHSTAMALGALGYGNLHDASDLEVLRVRCLRCAGGTKEERELQDADGKNAWKMTKFMFEDDVKYRAWIRSPLAADGREGEIAVTVSTSWARSMSSLTVEGTLGTLSLELDDRKRVVAGFYPKGAGEKEVFRIPPQPRDDHELECVEYCERVGRGDRSLVDEGLANKMMALISGAYLSNRRGKRVDVTPAELDEYVDGFLSRYPSRLAVDEIVWDLMAPFTRDYFEERALDLA
ncbi:MAG: Gfo/Idh/MocA family protein [Promethearchaeota archaeon]